MSPAFLYAFAGAGLIGIGFFGLIRHSGALRRLLSFNLIGAGVFLVFGVAAQRGAAAGLMGDPVPQAMVITGLVVAFAASALAAALIGRLAEVSDNERET